MANPLFLERDVEREHTDGLARRPRYIRAWLVDRYHSLHVGLPFSALLRNKRVLYSDKKNKSTDARPCGSSSSTTRTTALGSSPLREVEQ